MSIELIACAENAHAKENISMKSSMLNLVRFRDINVFSLYQINALFVSVVNETKKSHSFVCIICTRKIRKKGATLMLLKVSYF